MGRGHRAPSRARAPRRAFSLLSVALTDRVVVELASGRMAAAESLAAEAEAAIEATGSHLVPCASINSRRELRAALADVGAVVASA